MAEGADQGSAKRVVLSADRPLSRLSVMSLAAAMLMVDVNAGSVSRVGRSGVGAAAARIRALLALMSRTARQWTMPMLPALLLTQLPLLAGAPAASVQEAPPVEIPDELDALARQMTFDQPTRVAGRLLSFDPYDEAIWFEWTHFFTGRRWLPVPTEMQFLVYPRDATMMGFFRRLKPGALLRMTVQTGADGKRRVLELDGA